MKILRGTFRIITFLLMLILTTGLVLATAWLPVRVRGVRLSAWLLVPICRLLLPLFNVEFTAREAQRTTEGIHRDDWVFDLDGYALKKFGSQGQQKSYLIALKLALFCLLQHHKNTAPILLLDDIFDKLDPQRIAALVQIITAPPFGQVLMTDTQTERVAQILHQLSAAFQVVSLGE